MMMRLSVEEEELTPAVTGEASTSPCRVFVALEQTNPKQ